LEAFLIEKKHLKNSADSLTHESNRLKEWKTQTDSHTTLADEAKIQDLKKEILILKEDLKQVNQLNHIRNAMEIFKPSSPEP